MSMSDDLELQRLESEANRLAAYVAPHDRVSIWLTLGSVVGVCAACVFLLSGAIQGQVSLVNLIWMTVLAALIVYAVTRQFRWQGRPLTIGELIWLYVGQAIAAPDDLDEVRTRLIVCRTRIADLKRSRR